MKSPSIRLIPLLALLTLNAQLSTASRAQSTIDPAKQHSWAANTGFINWKPDQPLPAGGAAGKRGIRSAPTNVTPDLNGFCLTEVAGGKFR